jgi:uncharacterized protein (TIGR03435 family)
MAAGAIKELLVQRFSLRYHMEQRSIPVYGLSVIPGRFKLKPVSPAPEYLARFPEGDNRIFPPAKLEADFTTMNGLSTMLSLFMDHLVVDHTGLTDRYTFVLTFDRWIPHGVQLTFQQPGATTEADAETGPPIGTALEQQLGLRLTRESMMMPVAVIDTIERPSAN